MQCKYRVVVSIDGGGIRGVIPLRLIQHIQKVVSTFDPDIHACSWVDLFSATSTGAIIAGGLMLNDENGEPKHSPEDLINLYISRGEQIFARSPHKITANHSYPLSFVLDHFFGKTSLDELDKHFLFVSYDLNADEPYYFTDSMDRLRTMSLSSMMKACSATPGVFPPVKLGYRLLADGIIATKNTSRMAYNYARLYYPNDPIILISLGAGNDDSMSYDLYETESNKTHEEMLKVAKEDHNLIYFRFQPDIIYGSTDINDASSENTNALIADADAFILTNDALFDRLFSLMKIRAEHFY